VLPRVKETNALSRREHNVFLVNSNLLKRVVCFLCTNKLMR